MAAYLVTLRLKMGSDHHFPGEVLTLDPAERETRILMDRGYITPVPSDYPSLGAKPKATRAANKPTDAAPPPSNEVAELMAENNRDKLNELALEAGITSPEELSTKREVAEAIVAALEKGQA